MTERSSLPSPRALLTELQEGHRAYLDILRTETPALMFARHLTKDEPHSEFFRAKVGFLVLSRNRKICPSLIFNQREERIIVKYAQQDSPLQPSTIEQIEWAYQSNRLRLIVLLGALDDDYGGPLQFLTRLIRRDTSSSQSELTRARRTLISVHRTYSAIIEHSEAIRSAVSDGKLGLIESIYDPYTDRAYLDVGGVLSQKEALACS